MSELPFSPDIERFSKPVEVGDTNEIYYDPQKPDVIIRVPVDYEAQFLENDPKLIKVVEKIYRNLDELGRSLDITVAPHQFILARETSGGPVKPMVLAKKIEGRHIVPIDRNDPVTLDAIDRIAQWGFRYLKFIEKTRPKSVGTDFLRPDQFLIEGGSNPHKLTLVDVEARLHEYKEGKEYLDLELAMLVAPLRDSVHMDTFRQFIKYAVLTQRDNLQNREMSGMLNAITNSPELYQQIAIAMLQGETPAEELQQLLARNRRMPLIINRAFLQRFGIENLK